MTTETRWASPHRKSQLEAPIGEARTLGGLGKSRGCSGGGGGKGRAERVL